MTCFAILRPPAGSATLPAMGAPRFNERLRRARLARGYSQAELADALHMSRETINRIERLHLNPSTRVALAIAREVNRSVEQLFWYLKPG